MKEEINNTKIETEKPTYREVIKDFNIDVKELVNKGLDDKGNIKNGIDVIRNFISEKLPPEFKDDFLRDNDADEELWGWKNIYFQIDLAKALEEKIFKKDIEKIQITQYITDLEEYLRGYGEGDFGSNYEVIDFLKKLFSDHDITILEKIFLKNCIHSLHDKLSFFEINNFENLKKNILNPLKKEIGKKDFISRYFNKELSSINFFFNEDQKNTIKSDSFNNFGAKLLPYEGYGDDYFSHGDYITNYLTPDVVGVYTLRGRLVGWQDINNLKEKDNTIKDAFDIKNEYQMMNSRENLALFKVSSSLYFRDYVQKSLNIDLSKLSLNNQFYFLNFIQGKTEKDLKRFKKFIKKSQNDIEINNKLKTFLSIEQGGEEMGDKILALGEKLPEEVAHKVFEKYGEIIDTAHNIKKEIKDIFGNRDIPEKVLISVKETLLKRGSKMLSDFGNDILDPKFKIDEQDILKELDEIKEEIIILGKSYVGLYKEGIRVPIDEVTTIKEIPTQDLNKKKKEQLIKIYEEGRPKITYESEEHLEFLKNEFEKELNDKNFFVNEICFENETIIIALVDKKDKENIYVGGLTFVEEVKNAVVAEATMSHLVEKFKNKNIKALVDSKNPLIDMYLKRFGFKITKKLDSLEEIKNNGGQIYVEIEKLKQVA